MIDALNIDQLKAQLTANGIAFDEDDAELALRSALYEAVENGTAELKVLDADSDEDESMQEQQPEVATEPQEPSYEPQQATLAQCFRQMAGLPPFESSEDAGE
jgi:hypothetical protein